MITTKKIIVSQYGLAYITDNDVCIQYDFDQAINGDGTITPLGMTREQLEDAARQFVAILNIAAWDEHLGENIDKHMEINGYTGTAHCY